MEKEKLGGKDKQEEHLASEWGQANKNQWNQTKIGFEYKPQLSSNTNDH